VLSLTDTLADAIYDQPLTIRSEVPANWAGTIIQQGNSSIEVNSTVEGTATVVYYDAVPDRGDITLRNPEAGSAQITALKPAVVTAGSPGFLLRVFGNNFLPGSVVWWNGADRVTEFVSATQVNVAITSLDLATPGTMSITVFSPDGSLSHAMPFEVRALQPYVTGLSPSWEVAGGPSFTLTVEGSNFVSGAKVRWNGSDQATSFVSNSEVKAAILAADIATPGNVSVTCYNPPPGGGTSKAVDFDILPLLVSPPLAALSMVGSSGSTEMESGAVEPLSSSNSSAAFVAADIAGPGGNNRAKPPDTIGLSSCSESDVNNAIATASHGDIIVCPPGDWSWSNVDITKNITLQGAGIGNTNISITKAGGIESPSIYSGAFRVTGFTFTATENFGTDSGLGMMRIHGNKGFRVDHNRFEIYSKFIAYSGGNGIFTQNDVGGLMDHNEFVNHPSQLTSGGCIHAGVYPEGHGDNWYLPSQIGSYEHTVFIEDNYFREAKQCSAHNPHAVMSQRGGIYVFRHNELRNFMVDSHGFEVLQATREYEISNNNFIIENNRNIYRGMYLRGGTGVIYGNTLTLEGSGSMKYKIVLTESRVSTIRNNPARPELYGGVGSKTCCSAEEGYPCTDQIGRGHSVGTSPNMYQVADPLYVWDNMGEGNSSSDIMAAAYVGSSCSGDINDYIQPGRDYFVNSGPKPEYTPYTYPHPLTSVTTTEPVAGFAAAPTSGAAPLDVQFSDSSTGTIDSWSWDFGDGSPTSSTQNPAHTYITAGNYSVSLTVSGPGGSDSDTQTDYITVTTSAPVAGFAAVLTSGTAPLDVQFTDSSTGTIDSWSWDFGDGSATASIQNPAHTYATAGSYTVSLTVTGPGGADNEMRVDYITATTSAPVAGFTATSTSGTAPLDVQFTDSSTGTIDSWSWDFGDGSPTSSIQNPAHTYVTAGNYSVSLTVTGPGGADSEMRVDYITATTSVPVAGFTATPTSGTAPLDVQFSDSSTGAIDSWSWDFGDGSPTASIQNPDHTYATAGSYTVSLTVSGPGGSDSDTRVDYITVTTSAPVAGFAAAPTGGVAPLDVQFSDSSTGTIDSWSWDFGDGSATASIQNPDHTYVTAGSYTVSLTVTGPGGTDSDTKTDYITVTTSAPVAGFAAAPTSGVAPLAVQFTDSSTGTIDSWSWDFGDGSATSSIQNPAHTYVTAGSYTVSLTVTGPGGSDSDTQTDYITVTTSAPVAGFTATSTSGTAPLDVQFTDSSTGTIDSWSWDFGDGSPTASIQNPAHTYVTAGNYSVSLTVTGPGGTDSDTKTDYITAITSAPVAGFTATPTGGVAPLGVQFTDFSTGAIDSWSWDFGDGSATASIQNPAHTYATAGSYTVSLTVTGPGGSDSDTQTDYITVTTSAPVAGFTAAPTNGAAPLAVQFTDSSTGAIDSWSWDFGDGSATASIQNPAHTYVTAGNYSVSLTVTGPGGSDSDTQTDYITVTTSAPVAGFTATPTNGVAPLGVQFTDSSTGTIDSWSWDFGDGSATSSIQNPAHTYATAGSYTVSLTVTGPGGSDSDTRVDYITVTTSAPVAGFAAAPTNGAAPLAVQFTDSSTGTIDSWSWDFGDGSATSSTQNPAHTYITAGNYSVSLTVTGPGGSDSDTRVDYITVTTSAPVAGFAASPTSGTAPLGVQFTDSSTGTIDSWSWDFGDGSATTSIQNPAHTYATVGSYTVSLTVTGPGGSDSDTQTDYITVTTSAPVAGFTATPTGGVAPLGVQFTDSSTGTIDSWSWDFGDGSPTSSIQNPAHTYATAGSYTVSLTVTGPGGADSETRNDYITVTTSAPVAGFTATPTNGAAPLAVQFTDSSTGTIDSWSWDFGDGSATSSIQNTDHTYATAGSYTVSLTVTGPGGADSDTKTDYITVTTPAPVAGFAAVPTNGAAPLAVQFTDFSTGTIDSWSWDLGDGSPTSSVQNPAHTYVTAGSYTVSLTVTGPGGSDSDTQTDYITVTTSAPVAGFTATPTGGVAPLAVQFSDSSTGTIDSWSWDFGDGSPTASIQNPAHTYATAGSYTVSLTVTGPGGTDSDTKTDYITATTSAPVAGFTATPTGGVAPLAVQFSDSSTGTIDSWSWDFGDGSATSSTQNPAHTYITAGNYSVSLTVTGPGGSDSDTRVDYITITTSAPVAGFTATSTSGTAPLDVQFTDSSTGTIDSWSWDFGDGSATASIQNPAHTYATAGSYTVSLTVTGPGGADSETRNDYITATTSAPVAGFTAAPTNGAAPLAVQFTDSSTGTIDSWSWDFGDGSATASIQNPAHTYVTAGNYSVSLTVTGPGGADSDTRVDYITVTTSAPVAGFTASPTNGAAPLAVQFSDSSTGTIDSWSWDFGDGSATASIQNPAHTYAIAGNYSVSLTVTGPGGADSETRNDYITVTTSAPVLVALNLDPSSVVGGSDSMGTVILNGPAPSGGALVALASSPPFEATVPPIVTVESGNTTATFIITTSPVRKSRKVNISARYGVLIRKDLWILQ
jgi:PKD repeat protein